MKSRDEAIRNYKRLQVQLKDVQLAADEARSSQEAIAARVKEIEKKLRAAEADLSQSQEVCSLSLFSPCFLVGSFKKFDQLLFPCFFLFHYLQYLQCNIVYLLSSPPSFLSCKRKKIACLDVLL